MDSCTRLAWVEVVEDLKSLSVMFAALKSINLLNVEYGVRFEAILTDNGPEVASKDGHPFERMLMELGIKHRYTRPYRPQTNGKVERFWRTLNEDLLEETTFESVEELKNELMQYLLYYNTERPHQGLGGKTPLQTLSVNELADGMTVSVLLLGETPRLFKGLLGHENAKDHRYRRGGSRTTPATVMRLAQSLPRAQSTGIAPRVAPRTRPTGAGRLP